MIKEPTEVRRKLKSSDGAHMLDETTTTSTSTRSSRRSSSTTTPADRAHGERRRAAAADAPADQSRPHDVGRRRPTDPDDRGRSRATTAAAATEPRDADRAPVVAGAQRRRRRRHAGACHRRRHGRRPPVPSRATGAMPAIKRAAANLDSEEPTNPNRVPGAAGAQPGDPPPPARADAGPPRAR